MKRVWLVVNRKSGSAAKVDAKALEKALETNGFTILNRSHLFDDALPAAADLEAADAEAVMVLAGDGTINHVVTSLEGWSGRMIILPGGTMNMLPRALHGEASWDTILAAPAEGARFVPLPYVEAGDRRSYVAIIAGPAATWVHAREAVRGGRLRSLARALRFAWRRSTTGGIRIAGERRRQRAILVSPRAIDLEVATFRAGSPGELVRLGTGWLTGDWRAAPGVTVRGVAEVTLSARRPIDALFDGEPHKLPPGAVLRHGTTTLLFLSTRNHRE